MFITGVFQSIVIFLVFVIFYLVDVWSITRNDRRRTSGSGRSWDYTIAILIAMAFIILQPALLPGLGLHSDSALALVIQLVGLVLAGGGLALNIWARLHLRHFYAERVEIQPGHQVINTGPYAYVRHPIFTSFFMIITGLLLVNPSLPLLLMAVYTYWDFSRAARQEENLLSEQLPGYAEYMQQTTRFVPRPNRRASGGL